MVRHLSKVAIVGYGLGFPLFAFAATRIVEPGTRLLLNTAFILIVIGLASSLTHGWKVLKQLRWTKVFILGNVLLAVGAVGMFYPWPNLSGIIYWLSGMALFALGLAITAVTAFKAPKKS